MMSADDTSREALIERVARVTWETSRADEGTISATGARIVATAVVDAVVMPLVRLPRGVEAVSAESPSPLWMALPGAATKVGKHAGEYNRHRDLERAYQEARGDEHEGWCHWDCPGHNVCDCPVADGWERLASKKHWEMAVLNDLVLWARGTGWEWSLR